MISDTHTNTDSQWAETAQPKSNPVKLVVKITLSVLLLIVIVQYTGLEATLEKLSSANLWYIPAGVVFYLFSQLISAYRWQFLSVALNFRFTLLTFYNIYLIGMFFNLFLPGAIGGDMLRMVYLARNANRKKREALLTLLAERGVGLIALLFLSTLVCFIPPMNQRDLSLPLQLPVIMKAAVSIDLRLILYALSSIMVMGYVALWMLPLNKLTKKLQALTLLIQARVYWADTTLLVKSIAISLLVHMMMVIMHLLIATALGVSVPVLYITVVYGIVSLASVLPIAFNGFGVREGVYVLLLTKIGISPQTALAFALYWVIISTVTSLLGGIVFLQGKHKASQIAA
ncbi:MAG: lysylphosphatidylglycerol synthase transmembrane domain-containing protein [Cyanobacteria bacterium P01_H01_bin.74]